MTANETTLHKRPMVCLRTGFKLGILYMQNLMIVGLFQSLRLGISVFIVHIRMLLDGHLIIR